MEADEDSLFWQTLEDDFASRTPLLVLLEGDATTWLSERRAAATAAGVKWLEIAAATEQARKYPFGFWTRLAEARPVQSLSRRLRSGPPGLKDPECPLLPDPLDVYHAISLWLAEEATKSLVLVLRDIDCADNDCLAALTFVARALNDEQLVLVLVASGRPRSHTWIQVMHQLEHEVGLVRVTTLPVTAYSPHYTKVTGSVAAGIAWCRAGALYQGSSMLARALAEPERVLLGDADEATAWQCLAMAMLKQRDFNLAALAARRVLLLSIASGRRRLARRTLMMALYNLQSATELRELGIAAWTELNTKKLSRAEQAWLRLDSALGCSLADPEKQHDSLLESILALPTEVVPPECRATAHLWRAASHLLHDSLDLALVHQRAGLALLESEGDYSRIMFVRFRLAATLLRLGHFAESAADFEQVARQGLCAGQFLLTAESLSYAVSARVALGDLDAAKTLLGVSTRKQQRIWEEPLARLLHRRAEATIALASEDLGTAEVVVNSLLLDLEGLPKEQASWGVRLTCEGLYLLGDVARAEGDDFRADYYTSRGLSLATQAAPEERSWLIAAGHKRRGPRTPRTSLS